MLYLLDMRVVLYNTLTYYNKNTTKANANTLTIKITVQNNMDNPIINFLPIDKNLLKNTIVLDEANILSTKTEEYIDKSGKELEKELKEGSFETSPFGIDIDTFESVKAVSDISDFDIAGSNHLHARHTLQRVHRSPSEI